MRMLLGVATGAVVLALAQHDAVAQSSEQQRIAQHLGRVEEWLRAQDTSQLMPSQRRARTSALDELRRYWEEGLFPQNTDFPGERVPYFFDDEGIPCAVAQLVLASGESELAANVRRDFNNAYLPDMRVPELAEWATANGFTLHELAMIQPDYQKECETERTCELCTLMETDCQPPAVCCDCLAWVDKEDGTPCDPDGCDEGSCLSGYCNCDKLGCSVPQRDTGWSAEELFGPLVIGGLALAMRRRRRRADR